MLAVGLLICGVGSLLLGGGQHRLHGTRPVEDTNTQREILECG
jgi:hypothetical protein